MTGEQIRFTCGEFPSRHGMSRPLISGSRSLSGAVEAEQSGEVVGASVEMLLFLAASFL